MNTARPHHRLGARMALTLGVMLLLMLASAASAAAAPSNELHRAIFDLTATPSWWHGYQGIGAYDDAALDVVIDKSGAAYVCGELGDAAGDGDASLMKLSGGDPAWPSPKTYDGPAHSTDYAYKVALGPGKSVYTAGGSEGANGKFDVLVLKWSASGAVQWARRYDGPAHDNDQAVAIGVDPAGNVTVAGSSSNGGGDNDWAVVSWSSSGARRWAWRYDGPEHHYDAPTDLVVAGDGSVFVTGYSQVSMGLVTSLTVRLSSWGSKLWQKAYAGPEGSGAEAFAAAARPGGGVFVGGTTSSAATHSDGLVVSYKASGARSVFALDTGSGGATDQSFSDLAVTSTGQVVAVGYSAAGGNSDCHVATYTKDGTLAGQLSLPGAWYDSFSAVAADPFGGYVATGQYRTAVNKSAIVSARGSVLAGGGGWLSIWAPAFVSEDNWPNAVAVQGSTSIVVGAYNDGSPQGRDQAVLGYVY
jgi:hypothetical protein